ncbi:Peroxidase [Eumeta japonica]|uniref:Peroxidase n=1 Tax=Eumeta variegata TaxID=151549 RepID=A0A4C1UJ74_EUMVA|nr:Peroxidase [Eumeta japonica]
MLNGDAKNKIQEKCSRRKSECDGCGEHSTFALDSLPPITCLSVALKLIPPPPWSSYVVYGRSLTRIRQSKQHHFTKTVDNSSSQCLVHLHMRHKKRPLDKTYSFRGLPRARTSRLDSFIAVPYARLTDAEARPPSPCSILEETMKMVLFGVVLWLGVTFGSHVAPYPLNLIESTDIKKYIIHPPPMYDFPFPSAQVLRRIPAVTAANANRSIDISKFSVSLLERLEDNLCNSDVTPKKGSAAQGLLIQGYPSGDAMHYEKSSMIVTKASQNLVVTRCTRYGIATDECASFISTLNLRGNEFGQECAALERFSCRTQRNPSRFRTFDGSCNNPKRSSWGQALTGYKRLLHPRYADGIEQPRHAVSNRPLPSARDVSVKLANNLDRPDDTRTMALAVWSQFVYHDLAHTPVRKMIHKDAPIRCCDASGANLAPRYLHPSCMPISVPSDDPHYSSNSVTCMEYTRSVTTYRGDCTFGAAEQMNQVSHFLDGSHIYGASSRDAAALREKTGGLLKTQFLQDGEFLPLASDPMEKCMLTETGMCFESGDVRANMHPWLSSLHTVWVREHNRVAREFARLNPTWTNERLYHEARRVVLAQLQHITYKHWLPALTGKAFDELYDSYDIGYNSDIDPTVTNSFATAASHFINSLLDQDIELLNEDANVTQSLRLKEHYYKPQIVTEEGGLEKLLRGMVGQKCQGSDFNYDNDVWQQYLGGLDALALDVQRGRDHGLPGYAQYRTLCGLPSITAFHHFSDYIPQEMVEKLTEVYENPADVDLVVGAMAERPLPGSLLGPTFTCLIKEQLWRTRTGDRYFYSHPDGAGSFNKRQSAEIRRASLARLLCDNTPIKRVQKDVFMAPSESNPVLPCEEIKRVNLEAWQDPAQQPDILTRTQQNVNKWIKNKVAKHQ